MMMMPAASCVCDSKICNTGEKRMVRVYTRTNSCSALYTLWISVPVEWSKEAGRRLPVSIVFFFWAKRRVSSFLQNFSFFSCFGRCDKKSASGWWNIFQPKKTLRAYSLIGGLHMPTRNGRKSLTGRMSGRYSNDKSYSHAQIVIDE